MKLNEWSVRTEGLDEARRFSQDALFMVGNGCYGVRGFFEEDDADPIGRLGGIYMAGAFGKGVQEVCTGPSRELCNLPQLLRVHLNVEGVAVAPRPGQPFSRQLCMRDGVYTRSYRWGTDVEPTLELTFQRFARLDRVHELWQRVSVTALRDTELNLVAALDTNVTNLNAVSSEPLPIQPGRSHILARTPLPNGVQVTLDDEDGTRLTMTQRARLLTGARNVPPTAWSAAGEYGSAWALTLKAGESAVLEKAVYAFLDWEAEALAEECVSAAQEPTDYAEAQAAHTAAWAVRWRTADIVLDGPRRDQAALRYDLFELIAACPLHTERTSIGARGLSGEMYEGCVFWDNEIFQLPFFLWSDPASARRLLGFRFRTLEAARARARALWFEGALFPWQVSEKGHEQTVREVGAFYAIHITADVAFALKRYVCLTGDEEIIREGGAELLVETARFWVSRADLDGRDGKYHLRAVRGPNEYDVYVDDNAYTNFMAAENIRAMEEALLLLERRWPSEYAALTARLELSIAERVSMTHVADGLVIYRDEERNLVWEDAGYSNRRPLDLKRAKPGGKRIIDTTLPYEALPLYQVTKQADVVLLMALFPERFSEREQAAAYDYYEPRTAHDSSLSYAPHGWLAARLGRTEEAYNYFEKSALLDVEDRQLNTISGLHYANFGGTWQMVFSGFFGIHQTQAGLAIQPALPLAWKGFHLRCHYRSALLHISLSCGILQCEVEEMGTEKQVSISLWNRAFELTVASPVAERGAL